MAAVAPMDLVVKPDPASIPLRCILCPKKPNFSDLSHLLTHVSSKSHLAHRFKAELRARDDGNALQEMREYDHWCEQYGINALLAERMAAKEQKKTGRRPRPSNGNSHKSQVIVTLQDSIKPDPDEYEPLPAMGHWHTTTDHFHDLGSGPYGSSVYQTPNVKRSRSDPSVPSTPDNTKFYRRFPSETETTDSIPISDLRSESAEFIDDEADASKLKGVRFPGMGLFDSADEVQKRMRNQRKADSVLKQIEDTSTGIEPNEFVWAEDGEFQRIRDIYASPSVEGSPDRKVEDLDVPKPKRGRRSAATAAPARASARLTRQRTSRNKGSRGGDENGSRNASGSADNYDVFLDPPKSRSGKIKSPLQETGYKLRRRPALQPLNPNLSLASPEMKPGKTISYMSTRDVGTPSFTTQPPVSNGHYFQHQHAMAPGTFNPLCVQARSGYYNPYGFSNYGNDTKPPTTSFQAINTMSLGNMGFNAFGGPYATDPSHERIDPEFDL